MNIGKIKLTKGMLDVTDPCYNKDVWCRAVLKNVKVGDWHAIVDMSEDERVARLTICHEEYLKSFNKLTFDSITSIGVDAGLAGFFEEKPDYNDDTWSVLCDQKFHDIDYGIATKESKFGCTGVWSSSGYGDGGYDVYVSRNDSGEIVASYIEFITDEDED